MRNNIVRISLVYILFFLIALIAVGRMVQLQFFDKSVRDNKYHIKVTRVDATEAMRGSILAADGRYLAFSTPEYDIGMDFSVPNDTLYDNNIEALAEILAKRFHERTKADYMNLFKTCRTQKRYHKLLQHPVDYATMMEISQYPILNKGQRYGGFKVDKVDHREYPYGTLARRTIGYVKDNSRSNGNSRIVMVGQREGSDNAVVWNKMWNENEAEEDAEWMFFPLSPDNTIPCPRLNHFNLLEYDDKCIAFGGASADGKQKALDGIYVSQDYGITWRPSTEIHMPIELEGIEGCIASTVDTNNYIWIITNAQVWRGRLNRLGFAQ